MEIEITCGKAALYSIRMETAPAETGGFCTNATLVFMILENGARFNACFPFPGYNRCLWEMAAAYAPTTAFFYRTVNRTAGRRITAMFCAMQKACAVLRQRASFYGKSGQCRQAPGKNICRNKTAQPARYSAKASVFSGAFCFVINGLERAGRLAAKRQERGMCFLITL